MTLPRMRTTKEAIIELKKIDSHTALTECAIRRFVTEGKIKSVKAGRKNLINMDQLIEYLNNPEPLEVQEEVTKENGSVISIDRIEEYKKNIGLK
ncbi:hypothetical protein Q5O24_11895 [Eubacteriaceae bacterium ES3]|nr:hypothetical protein Q5O24_11895 [Eubacteriaceae bacterium ES3]